MPRAKPLPQHLGSSFSVAAAARAGVTRNRLGASDLEAPFHGVRAVRVAAPALPRFEEDRRAHLALCAAYAAAAPARFAFSHATAARIYGIPLPKRLEARAGLDVAVPPGYPQPRGRGIRGHRVACLTVRMIHGLHVLPIELVWLQLASLLTLDELVVAGDHLVRRKRPCSTISRLTFAVTQGQGHRGCRLARLALADIRPGTDSPAESRVRLVVVRAGLPEPSIGHTVTDADGYWVGTPDLAFVEQRIAIEYEGDGHRTDARTFQDDIDRRERLQRAGWRVLRVTSRHLEDPVLLASRVRDLLIERATLA